MLRLVVKVLLALLYFYQISESSPAQHARRSTTLTDSDNDPVSEVVARGQRYEEVVSEGQCGSSYNMKLIKLAGSDAATCNDGTTAGYYMLKQSESDKWVIYLQGGWYCADEINCRSRKENYGIFYSSTNWPNCHAGSGIISTDEEENPHLSTANMVYIPYCSSDVWSGTSKNQRLGELTINFMGSTIIEQVVKRLMHNHGMKIASTILLAGSSAGATGVLINIDRVQAILNTAESDAKLRGVVDSGWYLYRPNMENDIVCGNRDMCSPIDSIKKGVDIWRPNIPASCLAKYTTAPLAPGSRRRHRTRNPFSLRDYHTSRDHGSRPRDHRWKCFFGHLVYPHIQTPLFVVQWMYDNVQLMSDDIFLFHQGNTADLLRYFQLLHAEMSQTFKTMDGIFAPSCIAHTTLQKSNWKNLEVDGINLPDAIQCWMWKTISASRSLKENPSSDRNQENLETENYRDSYNESNNLPTSVGVSNKYTNSQPDPTTCKYNAISNCSLPQCHNTCPTVDDVLNRRSLNAVEFIENVLRIDIRSIAFYYGNSDPMETWKMLQGPRSRKWLISQISKFNNHY